jgi:putative SbcD/Mre11-related phosphoesterase
MLSSSSILKQNCRLENGLNNIQTLFHWKILRWSLLIRPYIPWPVLFVKDRIKTAVVADLHVGFEFELSEVGINLPSQTPKLIENLLKVIKQMKAERLIILGDLKHSISKISHQEWRDVPLLLDSLRSNVNEIQIILGNHDGGIANFSKPGVTVTSSRGMIIGEKEKVGLFHGHAWPSPNLFEADCWVMGHSHPAIQFRGFFGFRTLKPVWIKMPLQRKRMVRAFLRYRGIKSDQTPEDTLKERYGVKAKVSKLIVMPTFNDLLVGLPFNARTQEELLGPILRSGGVSLNRAEVFMVDGTFLGALPDLRKLA